MVLEPNKIAEGKRQGGNCSMPESILTQAVADFRKLEAEFDTVKGADNSKETFQALTEHFRAHTIEDDFMDFNYGALAATILMHDGVIMLDRSVEVWDDRSTENFGTYMYEQLREATLDARL